MTTSRNLTLLLGGCIFGFGLAISGMTKPEVVLSFLQLKDLGLLLVMGFGVIIAGTVFQVLHKRKKRAPLTGLNYSLRNYPLNKQMIFGGMIFGVGWGISGMCPGAAYASLGTGNWPILYGLLGMLLGAFTYNKVKEKIL